MSWLPCFDAAGSVSLRDYVDLFDSAAEELRANYTHVKDSEGRYRLRHGMLTG